ncbi:MAG: YybH family protein [Candidatus Binatia bacterium]
MDATEPKSDEQQIRELMAEWRRAAEQDDLDAILGLMTVDAVFLTTGNPPMKSEDFAAGFRAMSGNTRLEVEQSIKEIHAAGDMAYAWSHLTVITTSIVTGARTLRSGDVLTIFRKSAEGNWLLSRDANLLPPADERRVVESRAEKSEIEFEPAPELAEAVLATKLFTPDARATLSPLLWRFPAVPRQMRVF